jgi:tight adherence protein C
MEDSYILYIIIISIGGMTGFAVWAGVDIYLKARATRLDTSEEIIVTETTSSFFKTFMPLARSIGKGMRAMLVNTNKDAKSPGYYYYFHQKLEARLAAAGHPEGIIADEYVGFSFVNAFMFGLLGAFIFIILEPFDIFTCFILGMVFGFLRMSMWLSRKLQERQTSIRRQLPFCLDLLTLAMEAGLDFTNALGKIVKKLGNTPLGQELSIMLREIQLGKTRSDAMRDTGRRVGVQEVQSVMTSLVQADEMGASIGPILRIQADQQRERRSQNAEERAGKAPVKMLFPLMLIVFATLLMIFGPIIIGFFV